MQTEKPLIFFDGICHLCNSFVDKVIQQDREGVFQFASLQGETAKKLLTPKEISQLESVVLLENDQKFHHSTAVLRILIRLGGAYKLFALAYLVPTPIRDWLYLFVAKNRYAWFGQKEFCRIPTAGEKGRLLP